MNGSPDSDELILWTFIQAGVDPYDPKNQQLLMKILDDRRENATYSVAIRAMILEELNRNAYQGQLLVVMPQGLGSVGPVSPAIVRRALAGITVDRSKGQDGLAEAAVTAVKQIAAESDVEIARASAGLLDQSHSG